jgi:hypothetical protein
VDRRQRAHQRGVREADRQLAEAVVGEQTASANEPFTTILPRLQPEERVIRSDPW